MLPYLILLIVILVTLVILKISNSKRYRFVPFLIMAIFSGLRYEVGVDTSSYIEIFYYIIDGQTSYYDIEFGYELLVRFIESLGGAPQLVFLLFSLATNYFIYKYINQNSSNYFLSTILYLCIGPFFLSSMNGMRQALAVAVFAFSLKYIVHRKPIKFLTTLLFFSIFHFSLVLMIPFYWIFKRKINYIFLFATLPILIIMFRVGIADYLIQALGYGNLLTMELNTLNLQYVLFLIIAFTIMLLTEREKNHSNIEEINLNMNYVSIYIIITSFFVDSTTSIVFTRFNTYFFISYIILIPLIVNKFQEKKLVNFIVLVISIIFYFITILSGNELIPFQFNFELFS